VDAEEPVDPPPEHFERAPLVVALVRALSGEDEEVRRFRLVQGRLEALAAKLRERTRPLVEGRDVHVGTEIRKDDVEAVRLRKREAVHRADDVHGAERVARERFAERGRRRRKNDSKRLVFSFLLQRVADRGRGSGCDQRGACRREDGAADDGGRPGARRRG